MSKTLQIQDFQNQILEIYKQIKENEKYYNINDFIKIKKKLLDDVKDIIEKIKKIDNTDEIKNIQEILYYDQINNEKINNEKLNKEKLNKEKEKEKTKTNKNNEFDRHYNHFIKSCRSVPDYMLAKLKKMPANKGFFWKNVACYGEMPYEKYENSVLFEKSYDGLLIIHEWSKTHYYIYHKKNQDKKILFYSEKRINH